MVRAAASALSDGRPSRQAVRALLDRMTEDGWTITDDDVAVSGTTYE
ncbi:hypothetical protein [Streptomyces sp. NPDC059909]